MRRFVYAILKNFSFFFHHLNKRKIRVLAYHTIPNAAKFEAQLKHLMSNYNIIDIHQFQNFIFKGEELPEKAVLITFDDGDISVLEKGLPILKKYELPSVLFVITGLIDSSAAFWWKRVEENFRLEGKDYAESRVKVRELKCLPNKKREAYLNNLIPVKARQLSAFELKKMNESKMYIGNHTYSHPMIDKCTRDEVEEELKKAKDCFTEWNLPGYSIFAYPNGNWDASTEQLLKTTGVKLAFLFDHKICNQELDPMRISRIKVSTDTDLNEFIAKVSGSHSALWSLRKKIFSN